LLEIASGHIVAAGIAEDISERIILVSETIRSPADDDDELALVIHARRQSGEADRLLRSDHRARRFEEDQRLGRHVVSELFRVSAIVPSERHDLARLAGSEEPRALHGYGFGFLAGERAKRVILSDRDDLLSFEHAVARSAGIRRREIEKSAETHLHHTS
jgi:hypothetical protein